MATATFAQNPDIQEQVTNDIVSKFVVPKDFLNMVFKKAVSLAKTTVDYTFKKSNIPGLTGNVLKTSLTPEVKDKKQTSKEPGFLKNLLNRDEKQTSKEPGFLKSFLNRFTGLDIFQKKPAEQDLLTEEETPKTILIGGFTAAGYKDFADKMPDILKGVFDSKKVEEETSKKSGEGDSEGGKGLLGLLPSGLLKALLPILGGATLILGGLAALVGAFMTQGPAKGTLEMIGKVGLKGGLVVLAKKLFGATLKTVLKKIPIIGTLISYGFAIQRFYNGDTVGGILDLVSGTVQLLDLVAPGLGTVLSLGVDILQAVLDAKAGGSSAEASAKKTGILLDWAKGLGSLLYKAIKWVPVIGPLIQATEDMINGKWLDATYNLVRAIPGVGIVIDVLDWFTGGKTQETIKKGIVDVGKWAVGMSKWFVDKVKDLPFINSLLRFGEHLGKGEFSEALKSLGHSIPFLGAILDWFGMKETNAAGETIDDTNLKDAFNLIVKLKDWVVENIVNKITGWITGIYDWGKEKLTSMGDTVANLFTGGSKEEAKGTVTVNGKEISLDEYEKSVKSSKEISEPTTPQPSQPDVAMADGGIVTQSTNAIIGEAGPEAVIPLEKYFDPKTTTLNNSALEQIASNTNTTNESLKSLSNAIFKLAQTFVGNSKAGNNIIVNNQNQQEKYPSASEVAANNIDPIRQVRAQFAI